MSIEKLKAEPQVKVVIKSREPAREGGSGEFPIFCP
jgi:hypothetical protein